MFLIENLMSKTWNFLLRKMKFSIKNMKFSIKNMKFSIKNMKFSIYEVRQNSSFVLFVTEFSYHMYRKNAFLNGKQKQMKPLGVFFDAILNIFLVFLYPLHLLYLYFFQLVCNSETTKLVGNNQKWQHCLCADPRNNISPCFAIRQTGEWMLFQKRLNLSVL